MNPSGGVRIILTLARGFAARGHEVTVTAPDYASEVPFAIGPGVRLLVVPVGPAAPAGRLSYSGWLARNAAADCDVAYATGFRTPWFLACSRKLAGSAARLIYLVQGHDALAWGLRGRSWLSGAFNYAVGWAGYRLPLEQVAVSAWVRDAIGLPGAVVIPNGVAPVFRPLRGREARPGVVVGLQAAVGFAKGTDVALDALRRVPADAAREVRLLLAWRHARPPLPELPVRVELRHTADDESLAAFYNECDIFLSPSWFEGFGLPPLEAMACGCAVVAADSGGIRSYATRENMMLVPGRDATALHEALVSLLGDAGRRDRLRTAGLATAREFGEERMIERHLALLDRAEG
jgi:glycosyltransferase involved in cell wall biosynthesis